MSEEKLGFFARLKQGLAKTRNNIVQGMDSVFHGFSQIDEDFYEELEESLVPGGELPAELLIRAFKKSAICALGA